MLRKDHKGGLDLWLVAALAVVLGIGGFISWRILSSDEDTSPSETSELATFESQLGITISYPSNWALGHCPESEMFTEGDSQEHFILLPDDNNFDCEFPSSVDWVTFTLFDETLNTCEQLINGSATAGVEIDLCESKTIDQISGIYQENTFIGGPGEVLEAGTKSYGFQGELNGKTFTAAYVHSPSSLDYSEEAKAVIESIIVND